MHRTRVAAQAASVATLTVALVPVVAAVVAAVLAGWAGVAVLSGLDPEPSTTTLLVEGGNRGW